MKLKTFKVIYTYIKRNFEIAIEAFTKAEAKEMIKSINGVEIVAIEAIKGY